MLRHNLSFNSLPLLSFLLPYRKPLSSFLGSCWLFHLCNDSLSFATSHLHTSLLLSALSLSLSHIFGNSCGEIVAWQGPGCFIEQRLLIFLFIERPSRQRACQPVPIAPHLSSCLGSYSLLVSGHTSDNPTTRRYKASHTHCACLDTHERSRTPTYTCTRIPCHMLCCTECVIWGEGEVLAMHHSC